MGNPSPMRDFVVAAWERSRHRERELRHVIAGTAEQAIVAIAAARPLHHQPGVYEAWPADDPASNLRITYAAASGQLPLRPERD
jgi:hypothetical protein